MKTVTKYIDSIRSNIDFRLGQNAKENFELIDDSHPQDLWFHIHQEPSTHVVVHIPPDQKYDKKAIHKIVIQGALLCKQHSMYRSAKDITIMYTTVQHVVKGTRVGTVSVEQYKTDKV